MAEEQVVTQYSQSLVLQNEHEKALEKLRNTQLNNLTAKQQAKLILNKRLFLDLFGKLSYSFLGLSESQLKEFSINELGMLDKLITHKARYWTIGQMLLTFGVPILGWVFGCLAFREGDFKSWNYLLVREYLKKIYGENFLSEALKSLKQKS